MTRRAGADYLIVGRLIQGVGGVFLVANPATVTIDGGTNSRSGGALAEGSGAGDS